MAVLQLLGAHISFVARTKTNVKIETVTETERWYKGHHHKRAEATDVTARAVGDKTITPTRVPYYVTTLCDERECEFPPGF